MFPLRVGASAVWSKTLHDVPANLECDGLFDLDPSDGILNLSLTNKGKDLTVRFDDAFLASPHGHGTHAWMKDYGWGSNIAVQCCETRATLYSSVAEDDNLVVKMTALPVSEQAAAHNHAPFGQRRAPAPTPLSATSPRMWREFVSTCSAGTGLSRRP